MARRPEAQSIIVIIKAVRAFPRAASVDTEALIAELREAERLNTITHEEVLALLEERFPEVEVLGAEEEIAEVEEMLKQFGGELPSGRRLLVSFAASLIAGSLVGYAASMAIAWLLAGAMLLGAGAFLTFLITLLMWIVGFILSYAAGKKVGAYILTGTVDEHIESVKNTARNTWDKVTGFFDNSATV